MGFFKDYKPKSIEVVVQGEKFTLYEPSAYDRIAYFDNHETLMKELGEKPTNFKQALAGSKSNAYLIAICLRKHFNGTSISQITRNIMEDVTDGDDLEKLLDAAEELAGLKIETKDLEKESSDTD